MKGTQTRVVLRARFLERNVVADNADDIGLLFEGLREIGGERHASEKIVSQSRARRNINHASRCGEAVGIGDYCLGSKSFNHREHRDTQRTHLTRT